MSPSRALLCTVALAAACESGAGQRSGRVAAEQERPATLADSLYQAGAFDEARRLWIDQLAEAWLGADSSRAARVLTSLGLVERQLGNYAESRRLGQQALDLKIHLDLRGDLFRSYNALGLLAWTRGDLDEAAQMFDRAAGAAAAAGDHLGVAKAAGNLALVHNDRGEPYRARDGFGALAEASRAAADTVALARTLINIAMLDIRLGDPLPAVARLEEARSLGRSTGDVAAEENALGQLATALSAMGQPQQALAVLDTARSLAESHGLRQQAAEDWKLLGDLFADAGDHRRALSHYARAQALNDALGLVEESGNAGVGEARSYLALGHADSAEARGRRALELHGSGGYRSAELEDHLLIAEIRFSRGDRPGAAESLASAATIARVLGTPIARARVALVSARLWDRQGRSQEVLRTLERVSDDLSRLGGSEAWEPDALRARAYARLGHLTAAEAAGRRAIAFIEQYRGAYAPGALRTSFLAARAQPYADLVVVLLRQGEVTAAFEVADAARGRALIDHLAAARRDLTRAPQSAADLLELDRLLREIDALTAELRSLDSVPPRERGTPHEESTRFVETRLAEIRRRYEDRLAVMAASPRISLLGTPSVSAADVQAVLRSDEALVEYLVSPTELHTFVVRPGGVTHLARELDREELAGRARLARELVARPDTSGPERPVLSALFDDLVQPLVASGALAGMRRVIIVPHGPLAYLPFAALIDEGGSFLVGAFEIAVLPSAAALTALRRGTPRTRPPATAAGLALAPLPDLLPATRTEVGRVRRVVGGAAILGRRATEGAARSGLGSARLVHIATHASMNSSNPMFSSVELAPGPGRGAEDDGRLEVHELLGLSVTSDLVFLSGCETGRGSSWATGFDRAEDHATLAQAFLYAGARDVVATLWRVDDDAAAVLAERFYEAYEAGSDPVAALARAQRAVLADARYRAPYYWASYEVLGTGLSRE